MIVGGGRRRGGGGWASGLVPGLKGDVGCCRCRAGGYTGGAKLRGGTLSWKCVSLQLMCATATSWCRLS